MSGGNVEAIAMNQLAHGDVADQISEWKKAVKAKSYDEIIEVLYFLSESDSESSTRLFDYIASKAGHADYRIRAAFELLQRKEESKLQHGFSKAFPDIFAAIRVVQKYRLGEIDLVKLLMESTKVSRSPALEYFWSLMRDTISDLARDLINDDSKVLIDYYMALLKYDSFCGFSDAVEYFTKNPDRISLSSLVELYSARSFWATRCDLIVIATELDSDLVNDFLSSIVSSRAVPIVRYYAAVALINRGETEWVKSKNRRGPSSPFWESLKAYANYHEGNGTFAGLQELAKARCTSTRDHWYWLTHDL